MFQQYYLLHCNYLLKMGRIDNEQTVFEQLTLSANKKWRSKH